MFLVVAGLTSACSYPLLNSASLHTGLLPHHDPPSVVDDATAPGGRVSRYVVANRPPGQDAVDPLAAVRLGLDTLLGHAAPGQSFAEFHHLRLIVDPVGSRCDEIPTDAGLGVAEARSCISGWGDLVARTVPADMGTSLLAGLRDPYPEFGRPACLPSQPLCTALDVDGPAEASFLGRHLAGRVASTFLEENLEDEDFALTFRPEQLRAAHEGLSIPGELRPFDGLRPRDQRTLMHGTCTFDPVGATGVRPISWSGVLDEAGCEEAGRGLRTGQDTAANVASGIAAALFWQPWVGAAVSVAVGAMSRAACTGLDVDVRVARLPIDATLAPEPVAAPCPWPEDGVARDSAGWRAQVPAYARSLIAMDRLAHPRAYAQPCLRGMSLRASVDVEFVSVLGLLNGNDGDNTDEVLADDDQHGIAFSVEPRCPPQSEASLDTVCALIDGAAWVLTAPFLDSTSFCGAQISKGAKGTLFARIQEGLEQSAAPLAGVVGYTGPTPDVAADCLLGEPCLGRFARAGITQAAAGLFANPLSNGGTYPAGSVYRYEYPIVGIEPAAGGFAVVYAVDPDGDGAIEEEDACPGAANLGDPDKDGIDSACDLCPSVWSTLDERGLQPDSDGDGLGDVCDWQVSRRSENKQELECNFEAQLYDHVPPVFTEPTATTPFAAIHYDQAFSDGRDEEVMCHSLSIGPGMMGADELRGIGGRAEGYAFGCSTGLCNSQAITGVNLRPEYPADLPVSGTDRWMTGRRAEMGFYFCPCDFALLDSTEERRKCWLERGCTMSPDDAPDPGTATKGQWRRIPAAPWVPLQPSLQRCSLTLYPPGHPWQGSGRCPAGEVCYPRNAVDNRDGGVCVSPTLRATDTVELRFLVDNPETPPPEQFNLDISVLPGGCGAAASEPSAILGCDRAGPYANGVLWSRAEAMLNPASPIPVDRLRGRTAQFFSGRIGYAETYSSFVRFNDTPFLRRLLWRPVRPCALVDCIPQDDFGLITWGQRIEGGRPRMVPCLATAHGCGGPALDGLYAEVAELVQFLASDDRYLSAVASEPVGSNRSRTAPPEEPSLTLAVFNRATGRVAAVVGEPRDGSAAVAALLEPPVFEEYQRQTSTFERAVGRGRVDGPGLRALHPRPRPRAGDGLAFSAARGEVLFVGAGTTAEVTRLGWPSRRSEVALSQPLGAVRAAAYHGVLHRYLVLDSVADGLRLSFLDTGSGLLSTALALPPAWRRFDRLWLTPASTEQVLLVGTNPGQTIALVLDLAAGGAVPTGVSELAEGLLAPPAALETAYLVVGSAVGGEPGTTKLDPSTFQPPRWPWIIE